MYVYTPGQWALLFFFYCFCGWVWESCYVSAKQRHWVNRGFLHGPLLPIYGSGAIIILFATLPVADNFWLVYFLGMLAATALEYVVGAVMEQLFKVRYWDYTKQPFNLHGYICLTSSIAWGFLTIFMTEVIHKPIEHFVLNLPPALEWCLLGAVSGCFVMDTIQSTKEALSLAKALESVAKLRAELEEMQVQLALLKAETAQNIENAKEELRVAVAENVEAGKERAAARREALEEAVAAHKETVAARRDELSEAAVAHKAALAARISALNEKIADTARLLNSKKPVVRPSILRRNPTAISRHFAEAWKELYNEWEEQKHA